MQRAPRATARLAAVAQAVRGSLAACAVTKAMRVSTIKLKALVHAASSSKEAGPAHNRVINRIFFYILEEEFV